MTATIPHLPNDPLPEARIRASDVPGLDAALRANDDLVVIFHATWCPFCQAFLAETAGARFPARVALVDVSDVESPLWDQHDVKVIPTVVRFERGREVARIEGRRGEGLFASDLLLLADDEPVGEDLQRFESPGRY